jgi:hypothetical protein
MRLSDETLRGRAVIASDGLSIGSDRRALPGQRRVAGGVAPGQVAQGHRRQAGAGHSLFRAGTLEVPIRLVQSVADAVILSVAVDDLRQVLPGGSEPAHVQ